VSGFYIEKKGSSLETVAQNSATLDLLARGDGTEILLQEIEADKVIQISSAERSSVMEFFYILSGSLVYLQEDEAQEVYRTGDYFYTHYYSGLQYLRTLEKTQILYVSTQPIFHYISEKINDLMEMVKSVEAKDYYTHSHGQRVQDFARKIAEHLGFSGERLERLLYAALFHDIGKVRLPDQIIAGRNKPTEEEWEMIKKHPIYGQEIVSHSFLRNVGEIIGQHHERLDGSGYPSGLRGTEILLEARIIAVIDAFDAMTTDRTYHKAMAYSEAVNELKRFAPTKFDEKVVNIFISILEEEGLYSTTEA